MLFRSVDTVRAFVGDLLWTSNITPIGVKHDLSSVEELDTLAVSCRTRRGCLAQLDHQAVHDRTSLTLEVAETLGERDIAEKPVVRAKEGSDDQIGRASCRERV